jgi:hypothetical protein
MHSPEKLKLNMSNQFAYALSLIRVGDGMYRAGWRWIFIIEGIVTIVAGIIAPFFLVECMYFVTYPSVGMTEGGELTRAKSQKKLNF